MRGKAGSTCLYTSLTGITPAYAGKRMILPAHLPARQDHPRLCGEKFLEVFRHIPLPGSPPPMRGKVFIGCQVFFLSGITPAYAGKRMNWTTEPKQQRDHPRLCGEKVFNPVKVSS